jgi:adenine phosphoribosyltransferase
MGPGAVSAAGGDSAADLISLLTRQVADFPSAGIQFKDLTPLFADPRGLAAVTDALADVASGVDLIAAIDARGFLIGGAVAARLGTGVLAIRKGGKLPPPVRTEQYNLEYGTASLELPADGIELAGRSVVIVDDVLATGGTVAAAHRLLEQAGAEVATAAVVVELIGLGGRERVAPLPVYSLRRM